MSANQSAHRTTHCTFTREFEGNFYEFSLLLNGYGEVMAVENHFLQLPPAARQLMAGNAQKKVSAYLSAWEGLLRFYAPLAVMGYMPGEEWEKIHAAVRPLQPGGSFKKMTDQDREFSDAWVREVYALEESGAGYTVFPHLANLLLLENDLEKYTALMEIRKAGKLLTEPVLFALLPVQAHNMVIRHIYETIGLLGTEKGVRFLISKLADREQSDFHVTILGGLARVEDAVLREQMLAPLLNYFRNAPFGLTDNEYARLLIRFFKDFPRPEIRQFLWIILKGFRMEPAKAAFEILVAYGEEEGTIARELHYVFATPKPPLEYIKSALAIYGKVENRALLPPSNELLDLFLWNCRNLTDTVFIQMVAYVMKRRLGDGIYSRLSPFLQHQEKAVREGAKLFFNKQGKTDFEQLYSRLQVESVKGKKAVLECIRHLAAGFGAPYLIRGLMQMKEQEPSLEREFMKTLAALLAKTPEKFTIPTLMAAVESRDPKVRLAAATGLEGFLKNEPKALIAIEKLWNDPDEKVKAEARRAYRSGLQTMRKKRRINH